MPPFCPPQILLRRIFGLLPVLEEGEVKERLEEEAKGFSLISHLYLI